MDLPPARPPVTSISKRITASSPITNGAEFPTKASPSAPAKNWNPPSWIVSTKVSLIARRCVLVARRRSFHSIQKLVAFGMEKPVRRSSSKKTRAGTRLGSASILVPEPEPICAAADAAPVASRWTVAMDVAICGAAEAAPVARTRRVPVPRPVCGAADAAPVPTWRRMPTPAPVCGAAAAAPVARRRTVAVADPTCGAAAAAPVPTWRRMPAPAPVCGAADAAPVARRRTVAEAEPTCGAAEAAPVPTMRWEPEPEPVWGAAEAAPEPVTVGGPTASTAGRSTMPYQPPAAPVVASGARVAVAGVRTPEVHAYSARNMAALSAPAVAGL